MFFGLCFNVALNVIADLLINADVQSLSFSLKHQQQVAQAVERAKQVTMAELNAIIGVRGLPGLPPTVCITRFHFLLLW